VTASTPDPIYDGWDKLDWRERRERRYQRWLSAPGVEFQGEAARSQYTERIQLLIVGFFTGSHDGLTKKEFMCDYQKSAAALMKFHEEFRPDFQTPPVVPARVFEMLGFQFVDWPGHGLADNAPWQYREGEYMQADEYDALIADPREAAAQALRFARAKTAETICVHGDTPGAVEILKACRQALRGK